MLKRAMRGVALVVCLGPGSALAQGVSIDHKAVGCIVAEKYPKMTACFSPSAELARARVYFRPEDGPPNWYYVEMKADAPCHMGVLPKPKKQLIGKKVLYYVNAFDQKFVENRTADNEALVVGSEGECKKDVPVAPFATSAPAAVFPAVPAGFAAAGLGTGAVVAAVAGGAAVVGGGVALATKGNNNPAPTTTPVVTTPAVTTPTTTTTTPTTLAAVPFNPIFRVFVNGVLQTSTLVLVPEFPEPQVVFDMCASTGPGPLAYNADISITTTMFGPPPPGFPTTLGGACNIPVHFGTRGITTPFGGTSVASPVAQGSFGFGLITGYDVNMRVETKNTPGNNPQASQLVHIQLNVIGAKESLSPTAPTRALSWASYLEVPEATGQVVVNGSAAAFAGPGRSTALATGQRGENRIEAQLVQGGGKPGTWRFDLGPTTSLVPGSVRVLAGTVAEVSSDAIVFRLSGRAGERVVFTFRTAN